jgi:hypothetical protein
MNADKAILAIEDILYPGGDPDHEWDADTLDEIVQVIREWRDSLRGADFMVRRDAPETSKAIVDKIRRGSLQSWLLRCFEAVGPRGFTDDELEEATMRTHQSVSATRNTLMRKGYVRDSGSRRKTRSGNPAIVYVRTGKVSPP